MLSRRWPHRCSFCRRCRPRPASLPCRRICRRLHPLRRRRRRPRLLRRLLRDAAPRLGRRARRAAGRRLLRARPCVHALGCLGRRLHRRLRLRRRHVGAHLGHRGPPSARGAGAEWQSGDGVRRAGKGNAPGTAPLGPAARAGLLAAASVAASVVVAAATKISVRKSSEVRCASFKGCVVLGLCW